MPKLVFTQQEINSYLKEHKEAKHVFYDQTVEMAEAICVHADGKYPQKLIEERRPNEPQMVMDYRKKIWVPKTKPSINRVFTSLQKIRRSADWAITYKDQNDFKIIIPEESLETYMEKRLPTFQSITNWAFSLALRKNLIDANAVVMVKPIDEEVPLNGYRRPVPEIFDSCNVIEYIEEDYAVLENPDGAIYYSKGVPYKGRSIYIVTTMEILKYDQINARMDFRQPDGYPYVHGLGMLPVRKFKGVIVQQAGANFLNESRIAGMLPELDEAAREYSDLQAARVNHIYPERYEHVTNECTECRGRGRKPNPTYTGPLCGLPETFECDRCKGVGFIVAGPYSKIIIKPTNNIDGKGSIPSPPAGYVEKDVTIVKYQDESVRQHIYDALAALNFQFVEQTPMVQSGLAKEVDKDELNNTVNSIAEDLVAIMDWVVKISAVYRYKDQLKSLVEIEAMLPSINVPEKFDLLSAAAAGEEVAKAKTAKANPAIINALEEDYAGKRFSSDPSVLEELQLILELDPLPNIDEGDKMSRLMNKGITKQSYVISSSIQEFIRRAIDENPRFIEMKTKEQKAIMLKYADEQIAKDEAERKALMVEMDAQMEQPADEPTF